MIKIETIKRISSISGIIEIPSKNGGQPYVKRQLVLDDTTEKDGNVYPNCICIEFTGDRMAQLDNFITNQLVKVEAFVSGREYNGSYFHNFRGLSIAPYTPQQPQGPQGYAQTAPQGYAQPPQQSYPPQGYAQPQSPYGQAAPQGYAQAPAQQTPYGQPYGQPIQQQGYGQPMQQKTYSDPNDDLPF